MPYTPYVKRYPDLEESHMYQVMTTKLDPWKGLATASVWNEPPKSKAVRSHIWRTLLWLAERADVTPNKLIRNINAVLDTQLYYWCEGTGTSKGKAIAIPSIQTVNEVRKETGICLEELTKELINHRHDREQFNSLLDSALALLGFQPKTL